MKKIYYLSENDLKTTIESQLTKKTDLII